MNIQSILALAALGVVGCSIITKKRKKKKKRECRLLPEMREPSRSEEKGRKDALFGLR